MDRARVAGYRKSHGRWRPSREQGAVTVPSTAYRDLYDSEPDAKAGKDGFIPWDKLEAFFTENLA